MSLDLSNYKIKANVKSLQEADYIFLGETRLSSAHKKANAAVIDALYREGEIVFIEENENNTKEERGNFHCQTKFVKSDISIKGWDVESTITLKDKFSNLLPQMLQGGLESGLIATVAMALARNSYHLDKVIAGIWVCCQFINFMNIFAKEVCKELPIRNRHMFKILEQNNPGPNKKRYILGGTAHFSALSETLKQHGFDNTEAMRELANYLKNKKYVILTPK